MKSIKCNIIKAGRGDVYGRPFAIGQIYTGPFDYVRQLVSCGYATVDDAAVFDDDSTPQNSEIAIVGKGRMAVEAELNEVTGGVSLSASGVEIPTTTAMTYAQLLVAVSAGFVGLAFVTDVGNGSIWVSDGTKARPMNGECVLYKSGSPINLTTTNSRTIGIEIPLPIGIWNDNDVLEVSIDMSKSGTADSSNAQVSIGNTGVIGSQLGNAVLSMASGGNRRVFGTFRFKRNSPTSVTLLNGPNGQDGITASSDLATTTATVIDMDTAQRALQITNVMTAGGSDVVSIGMAIVKLIAA